MKPYAGIMVDPALKLRPEHLRELRRLIAACVPNEEVWAYGSRVDGTAHDTSDLDLVVRHPDDLKVPQGAPLAKLKESLSESNLPLLVDILDWARLPPAFRMNIAQRHVVLCHPPSILKPSEGSALTDTH